MLWKTTSPADPFWGNALIFSVRWLLVLEMEALSRWVGIFGWFSWGCSLVSDWCFFKGAWRIRFAFWKKTRVYICGTRAGFIPPYILWTILILNEYEYVIWICRHNLWCSLIDVFSIKKLMFYQHLPSFTLGSIKTTHPYPSASARTHRDPSAA